MRPMIINGEALAEMKKLKDNSIDLIIADYPFNIGSDKDYYFSFIYETAKEFYRLLKMGGNLVVINNPFNIFKTSIFFNKFVLRNSIALIRRGSFGCSWHLRFNHNYCLLLCKGDIKKKWHGNMGLKDRTIKFNGKLLTDVIEYQNTYKTKYGYHPQAIPLDLTKLFIELLSNENDKVLDCFLGSGTTAVACKQLKRACIGIEINKEYYNIAKERLKNENQN